MPLPFDSTNASQVAVETTRGVFVPPTRKLLGTSFKLMGKMTSSFFRPEGSMLPTLSTLDKDWTDFTFAQRANYNELPFALGLAYGNLAVTMPGGATLARQWLSTPPADAIATKLALSAEQGDAGYAVKAAGLSLAAFNIKFGRAIPADITGSGIAGLLSVGITKTSSGLSSVPLHSLQGKDLDVFVDDTFGAIGTTLFVGHYETDFGLTGMIGPEWVTDSTAPSFSNIVYLVPTTTIKMTTRADANGYSFMTRRRSTNPRCYIRHHYKGGLIEGSTYETADFDFAVEFGEPTEVVHDGVRALDWSGQLVNDADMAGGYAAMVINTLSALG